MIRLDITEGETPILRAVISIMTRSSAITSLTHEVRAVHGPVSKAMALQTLVVFNSRGCTMGIELDRIVNIGARTISCPVSKATTLETLVVSNGRGCTIGIKTDRIVIVGAWTISRPVSNAATSKALVVVDFRCGAAHVGLSQVKVVKIVKVIVNPEYCHALCIPTSPRVDG